jgi:hypothetical protein
MCLRNLRNYEACNFYLELYADFFEPGKFNWLKLLDLSFLSKMHAGEYEKATKLFLLQPNIRRVFRWNLFQVFELFKLPRSVAQYFRCNDQFVIYPGIYNVQETERILIVAF